LARAISSRRRGGDSGTLGLKLRYHDIMMTAKDRMIRRGPWKLVSQPLAGEVRTMLFNVDEDPGCTRNCSAEFPEISARLSRALQIWITANANTEDDDAAATEPQEGRARVPAVT
jgi:hypothetical protein